MNSHCKAHHVAAAQLSCVTYLAISQKAESSLQIRTVQSCAAPAYGHNLVSMYRTGTNASLAHKAAIRIWSVFASASGDHDISVHFLLKPCV